MKKIKRVIGIVLDSVGIGEMPDAANYGDKGAATLQHTAAAVGGIHLPNLARMGLGRIIHIAGVEEVASPVGFYGKMAEKSAGKDTITGHWELAGRVTPKPFALFPDGFPPEIINPFIQATGHNVIGNKAASGTAIIEELGENHLKTKDWIVYTSGDSVFQVAAHEEKIPIDELYAACIFARKLLNPYMVCRVIARPFVGRPGAFKRTYNRRDFSIPLPTPTLLTALQEKGVTVVGAGKIHDIFSGIGLTQSVTTLGNIDGINKTRDLLSKIKDGFIFINLVDFDMLYGHRRDPYGYARALEYFDRKLPDIMNKLDKEDLLIVCADHGCDPTFTKHTDHTREYVPLLVWSPCMSKGKSLGVRDTFADFGATVAHAFDVNCDDWKAEGTSFLESVVHL